MHYACVDCRMLSILALRLKHSCAHIQEKLLSPGFEGFNMGRYVQYDHPLHGDMHEVSICGSSICI